MIDNIKMEDLEIFDKDGKVLHIADVISRCFKKLAKDSNVDKEDIVVRIDYKDDKPVEIIIEDILCSVLDTVPINGL